MSSLLTRIATAVVTRPQPVIAIVAFATLLGAATALRLGPDAGADTLVDRGSKTFAETERFKESFGDDPIVVLVEGDLRKTMLTRDLGSMLALEVCLSGLAPGGQVFPDEPAPSSCARLAALQPAQTVFGPGTFLREAAQGSVDVARDLGFAEALQLAAEAGIEGIPGIENPSFVSKVIFDSDRGDGTPKGKFASLFPSREAALIAVRMRPTLSDSDREEAISLVRDAVNDPAFKLDNGSYLVGGIPVVVSGLESAIQTEIFILLALAIAVMAGVLFALFGPPQRLLPLGIALAGAAVTFGLVSLFGGSLGLASIAVLPILIGLGVDYAIQLQARFREISTQVRGPARIAVETAGRGGRPIATAALATAAGFCVLTISPIPVVRGFGLLLVLGVVITLAIALTGGLATLSVAPPPPTGSRTGAQVPARIRDWGKRALAVSIARPGAVVGVAVLLAAAGWAAGTRTEITSDIRELAPADLAEIRSIDELEDKTGISGELNVAVRGEAINSRESLLWMRDFKQRVLDAGGYEEGTVGCRNTEARICPGFALSDLFTSPRLPEQPEIDAVLSIVPPEFLRAIAAPDPDGGAVASISFLIPALPLDEQKQLIDSVRAEIGRPGSEGGPPLGVAAEVVGLPALAADANAQLAASRYWLALAGLGAVALVLLLVRRSLAGALVPLAPIVLATGWSALLVEAIRVPLNPMSITLGALVIAISTEFSVILTARYAEERESGRSVGESLRETYSNTGAAVLASGVTAIAGFAVLIAEVLPFTAQIPLLRDFGIVTVVDLGVSLVGVLIVLPAVLVLAEGRLRRG